jgi:hypothetical protein
MKKPVPAKKKGIPDAAVYQPDLEEWGLGKRDRAGKRVGAWQFWWPSTGHLCGKSFFAQNARKETLERFHPDGTHSHQGITLDGKPMPGTMYLLQRSKTKTTELALQIPAYKAVFRMEQFVISKTVSKWKNFDRKGRRIDLEGNLLHHVDPAKYAKNFKPYKLPSILEKLVAFQNDVGSEDFAQGFVLDADDKGLAKGTCDSDGKRMKLNLAALLPIAAATGTGSWYFAWDNGTSKRVEAMPIVVFGDEGGQHVVAQNLGELLQIVATDVEPMVNWDEVVYFKNKDEDPSREIGAYRAWLKRELGLAPGKPKALVAKAQARFEAAFQAWLKK